MNDILIRSATEADFDAMWDIFHAHVAAGETYPFAPDTSKQTCHDYWFGARVVTNVAVTGRQRLLGMYRLVPNQVGLGSHVANASYMVSPAAQGVGVGLLLGQHSLDEARRLVIRRGVVVSEAPPAHARLSLPGRPASVDFRLGR